MRHRILPALPALAAALAGATIGLLGSTGAAGAAGSSPTATIAAARHDTFRHFVWLSGHALDPAHGSRPIGVRVYVNGHYRGHVRAGVASPYWSRTHHVRGAHGYRFRTPQTGQITSVAIVPDGSRTHVTRHTVPRVWPSAGTRITYVAARYVGHARYRDGGSSPATGFDCSGYTRYVYLTAHVRTLPHNAQAQRYVRGMHRISRSAARPGDLVFYLSGGHAYHVAIYAGHGMQYAAATVRDGIRHQPIWSRSVEFRTVRR